MTADQLITLAITASLEAGSEILSIYGTDFTIERKEDRSPLTLADKNAHQVIVKILSKTHIPLLSEEGKDIPFTERKNWSRLWIVDPLDGTKEFIKRNGEFTVNIALVEDHIPVMGVIYAPVIKTLYYAAHGIGAYSCHLQEKMDYMPINLADLIKISRPLPSAKKPEKYTLVASRSHFTPETESFIEETRRKYGEVEIISAGSSLKFCLVAEGKAHLYPRFGPTMEWDTAAGQAIVQLAGKKVVDLKTGKPLLYNRENLRNEAFCAG